MRRASRRKSWPGWSRRGSRAISPSASPARWRRGSSTWARSCTRATRWLSSTTPIFGFSSRKRRRNRVPRPAALVQAEAEERRLTTLSKQGWTANADFDKARSAADQARAAVTRADRAVSLARNAIDYATLRADADGVISAVSAEAGQVVAAGAPIVRLAHADEREAAVSVPETLVDRARSDSARVEFWALPGVSVNARLRELSPTSDAATRTYPARFTLVDAPAGVRLGMSVTVSLEADSAKVARMPISALFDIGQGPSVWVVDPVSATLSAARVVLAGYDAEWAFIGAGVPEGAKVVALGVHKLDQGEKVRVVDSLAGL